MSLLVSSSIYTIHQSVSELQWEITYISKGIIDTAIKYLPHKKAKKKSVIKDNELKALCRASRTPWLKWRDAGQPSHDKLAEEKKSNKKQVSCLSQSEPEPARSEIQERDCMFKNYPLRFKTSNLKTECSKLVVDGQSVTDTSQILHQFTLFFSSLAKSDLSPTKQPTCPLTISEMKALSYGNSEKLLDTEICAEEIENALKILKLGKSGGSDGLTPEHI